MLMSSDVLDVSITMTLDRGGAGGHCRVSKLGPSPAGRAGLRVGLKQNDVGRASGRDSMLNLGYN